jgi:hypothetical protein
MTRARRRLRIVRSRDEERLRAAVRRLLANGYDMGQISGIVLDVFNVRGIFEKKRPGADVERGGADDA